ncbi:hypothetical protein ACFV8E_31010 [Streptomyces sp. NPDC059849]|uniref:hypothetical protein n=1 Tax=Streptomyces sp. NPDC059849 TaxID=3346969 RepID=UPI003661741D
MYIEASRGTGRVIVPSLLVLAAERQATGAGRNAASPRFAEKVPFTAGHAVDAMDWSAVDRPVAHAAAIAWHVVKAGEPLRGLSPEPELNAGTGATPPNPTWPRPRSEVQRRARVQSRRS